MSLFLPGLPCSAQSQVPQTSGPTDREELETFLDGIFLEQMEKRHIPGAVFTLVKDGEIFFIKGYGLANINEETPVDPEKTLFRVASVSKLFTATAIMQLAERGLVSLDDDVNKYLKLFRLEDTYPEPVTFAHLLTHTGGVGKRFIGFSARRPDGLVPLGLYLAKRMPPRILPPGKFVSYTNHGYALLGYLVEVISGETFVEYIETNIFKPLNMQRSSFLLPPSLAPDLAVGYSYENGRYRVEPYDYVQTVPSTQLITTASDMAHFMIAHLQGGRTGETRILQEATAREMHQQQVTHHPRLPGFCYGFYERFENNQRAIEHAGGWGGFKSLVFLLPEHNLGFFLSYNNGVEPGLRSLLVQEFLDRYYPHDEAPAPVPPVPAPRNRNLRFAGDYQRTGYAGKLLEKLFTILEQVQVSAEPDGTLHVLGSRWIEVAPLLFQQVEGHANLAFREDGQGRITYMFLTADVPMTLKKLAWHETTRFHLALVGLLALVFLSGCIAWPTGYAVQQLRRRPAQPKSPGHLAHFLAGLTCALNLIFLVLVGLMVLGRIKMGLVFGVSPALIALLFIPHLTTLMTAGVTVFVVLAWKNGYWSVLGRFHYSLVTLAAMAFIPFLLYWNLLGFRY